MLLEQLFERFCNGIDQERAWTAREQGMYGEMFQTYINKMSNFELLEALDALA